MRLEQLEYVAAAARCGSLRQAAETLHVSLAAMSEAIAKLERELGVPVLDRTRSGVRVSREGAELMPQILSLLQAADGLRALASQTQQRERPVRLGTVNTGGPAVLLPALRSLETTEPESVVELQHLRQPLIEEGLLAGTLDLGLVNLLSTDAVHPDLTTTALVTGHAMAVMPTAHQLAREASVTVAQLRRERLVGTREGYLMHRVTRIIFEGEPPPVSHTFDGVDAGKQLVAAGLGIAIMTDFTMLDDPAEAAGSLTARPIDDPVPAVTMALLHKRDAKPFPNQLRLASALQREAARTRRRLSSAGSPARTQ